MIPQPRRLVLPLILLLPLALPSSAFAHATAGPDTSFIAGFTHPLSGLDHLVAMIAVGLWGAFLRAPAVWILPIVFPLIMAVGGAFGILGIPVPAVEQGIALSAIILGLAVALAHKPPLWAAALIVGIFAIFHGHAHGTELPTAADAVTYSAGFVIATGLLHAVGISFGALIQWPWGRVAVRCLGGIVTFVGAAFLLGLL